MKNLLNNETMFFIATQVNKSGLTAVQLDNLFEGLSLEIAECFSVRHHSLIVSSDNLVTYKELEKSIKAKIYTYNRIHQLTIETIN